jgi:hypothetical protein
MAKLPKAELLRRREERDGLDLSFKITAPPSISISADGSGWPRGSCLDIRQYARIVGTFEEGDRAIATKARFRLTEEPNIGRIKANDGRYAVGHYHVQREMMEASLLARGEDIAMLASGAIWTAVRLKISRPVQSRGEVWVWSIDAGEVWLDEAEASPIETAAAKPVLTPADLAERWSTSVAAVHSAIKKGELQAFQLGPTLYRVRREAAEEYEQRLGR